MVSLLRVLQSLISSRLLTNSLNFFPVLEKKIKEDNGNGGSDTLEDYRGEHHNFQCDIASIEELVKIVESL